MILFIRLLIAGTTGVLVWAFLASRGSGAALLVAACCSMLVLLASLWSGRPGDPDDQVDLSA